MQVGGLKVSYSVHTHAGADPGGGTKDNQVTSQQYKSHNSSSTMQRGVMTYSRQNSKGRALAWTAAGCCRAAAVYKSLSEAAVGQSYISE
jgi:hypothetical protein